MKVHHATNIALAGEHSERVSGFIADHYAAMNREDEALEYWLQASAFETDQGDPVEGANWGAKALSLMNADDPRGVKCALALGQTLLDLGHLSRAADLLAPNTLTHICTRKNNLVFWF